MNNIAPLEKESNKPIESDAKKLIDDEMEFSGMMTQKERHFKYYEMLNTLPVNCRVETTAGIDEEEEHLIEMNADCDDNQ